MANNDYIIKFGSDTSEVESTLKKVQQMLDKISAKTTQKTKQALDLETKASRAKLAALKVEEQYQRASHQRNMNDLNQETAAHRKNAALSRSVAAQVRADRVAAQGVASSRGKDFSFDSIDRAQMTRSKGFPLEKQINNLGDTDPEAANRLQKRLKRLNEVIPKSQRQVIKLKAAYGKLKDEVRRSNEVIRRSNKQLGVTKVAAKGASDSIRNMVRSYASIFAVVAGGQAMFRVGKNFETLSSSLLLASGSSKQAADDMVFLKDLSEGLSTNLLDTGKAYSFYAAAANSAGATNQEVKRTFTDATVGIAAAGLSTERQNLAFQAFQQIMSNGVVSMEELRQQLSQHLPQSMSVALKALRAMGHETGSVKDIISTGEIKSLPFMKEFTKILAQQSVETGAFREALGKVQMPQNKFNNALERMSQKVFELSKTNLSAIFINLEQTVIALTPFMAGFVKFFTDIALVISTAVRVGAELLGLIGLLGDVESGMNAATVAGYALAAVFTLLIGQKLVSGVGLVSTVFMTLSKSIWGAVVAMKALITAKRVMLGLSGIGLLAVGASLAGEAVLNHRSEEQRKALNSVMGSSQTNNQTNNISVVVEKAVDVEQIERQVRDQVPMVMKREFMNSVHTR